MKYKSTTFTVEEAKKKLEYYCAYQDRSHMEVERKLDEMRMIPEAKDLIMLHLIQEGFLNEERFARSFARGKFYHKKWGKRKIIQALKQHKIHPKLIDKSLEEIDRRDYIKTIEKLILQKQKDYKEQNPYKLKQKIFQYLLQKGYSFEEFADLYSSVSNEQ
jgi:regulatory protein